MAAANPISNPAAFDVFRLDKLFSPFSRITECNGRELTWQEQQAPGFLGAFVVFRGEKLVSVTYSVEIIARPGFAAAAPLMAYCHAAKTARPPKGMRLIDLRLADLRIPQVALARLPWQEQIEPGKWGYKFKFQEYRRLQIAGGVPKPTNDRDVQIFVAQQDAAAAKAQFGAAAAGARAAAKEHAAQGIGAFFK